jgi:hypothetical protein
LPHVQIVTVFEDDGTGQALFNNVHILQLVRPAQLPTTFRRSCSNPIEVGDSNLANLVIGLADCYSGLQDVAGETGALVEQYVADEVVSQPAVQLR